MSIFSNINVFDDHLMYHKTTRSYLEMSGNPETNFQKRKKASKKSEWKCVLEKFFSQICIQQIPRMLEPTTRQNKYNMLAYTWKIKFYDTLHITEKMHFAFCECLWLGKRKGGDFVSQLFLVKIAFSSETRQRGQPVTIYIDIPITCPQSPALRSKI